MTIDEILAGESKNELSRSQRGGRDPITSKYSVGMPVYMCVLQEPLVLPTII